jgi:ABC-type transporter Mla maintaining outer membrane lipid asymmetry ATPase subunit MlaF
MDINRKSAAVLKNMGAANKLVEGMQSDIQMARQVVCGQLSRAKDLEELVYLLKEDNTIKKGQIEELKKALDEFERGQILHESAMRVQSEESLRSMLDDNLNLKESIRVSEVQLLHSL